MAIRDIVKDGNELLRKKSRNVEVFDDKLSKLLDDMKATMQKLDGVGLAAPQVGLLRRAVVVGVDDFYLEMINPIIKSSSGEQIGAEACLSVVGRQCHVKRPKKIVVEYQDRKGEKHTYKAEDFIARVCCHEIDHLDGILFYDKQTAPPKKVVKVKNFPKSIQNNIDKAKAYNKGGDSNKNNQSKNNAKTSVKNSQPTNIAKGEDSNK